VSEKTTTRDFPIYFTKNRSGILGVPAAMTCEDIELLKQQLDNHLRVISEIAVFHNIPAGPGFEGTES
jgi:hypothetical protein